MGSSRARGEEGGLEAEIGEATDRLGGLVLFDLVAAELLDNGVVGTQLVFFEAMYDDIEESRRAYAFTIRSCKGS